MSKSQDFDLLDTNCATAQGPKEPVSSEMPLVLYYQDYSRDQAFIKFIKSDIVKNKKTAQGTWGTSLGNIPADPREILRRGGISPKELVNFCSTTSERWLREGGVDPTLPLILEPNNLYNYYNQSNKITPGGHKTTSGPVDGVWGK